MQAVILAAGLSTRTFPLTLTKPKPLLKVAGKALIEHNIDAISDFADEIIIVAGYKKEMLINFLKNKKYKKIKFRFIEQKEQKGTGHALMQVKGLITGRFILLMADDIYPKNSVKKCLSHERCVMAQKVKEPKNFGVFVMHKNKLWDVVEKPQLFISDLANCAFYVFDDRIFDFIEKVEKSKRGEYELTDALREYARTYDVGVELTKEWLSIGYPWDLLKADNILRKGKNFVGKNCKISGIVKNCFIGDNVVIKKEAIVKDSIVYNNSKIEKKSLIEDSVIGENVIFSGKINSNGNGAIIADNVNANDVDIAAGVKIWPDMKIEGKIREDVRNKKEI